MVLFAQSISEKNILSQKSQAYFKAWLYNEIISFIVLYR